MNQIDIPTIELDVAKSVASVIGWLSHKASAHDDVLDGHLVSSILAASTLPVTMTAVSHAAAAETSDPPPGGDKFDELVDMLNEATKPPDQQAAAGGAPAPTTISVKPPAQYLVGDMKTMYLANRGMLALSQLYANILDISNRKNRGHPDRYKISDPAEAIQAYADQADSAYQAMTGPLAGFYIFSSGTLQSYKKSVNRSEFHLDFLRTLLSGFNFADPVYQGIDVVLNNFVNAFGQHTAGSSDETKTFNNIAKINLVDKVNISGDPANPQYVWLPSVSIFYIKITGRAWKTVTRKFLSSSANEHIDVEMYWSVTKCELNMDLYNQSKPKFDKIMAFCTRKNLEEFGANLDHEVEDPNMT